MRDGSVTDRACAACGGPLPGADPRRRYCSPACRMRAHRARRAGSGTASATTPATATSRVYECPGCGERLLDERRCPECNLFCRALGAGGECPCCGEPIALIELLGQDHHGAARAHPPRSGSLAFGSVASGGGWSITGEDAPM